MPLLSVIIPVYNVEQYIKECFDSLIIQIKDADIEIICIDDGSIDKSGTICDEYASKYNRITVIHQENQGVSSARNCGLNLAKGKYIAWIDPDDYIANNWYQEICNVLITERPDILFFDYILLKNGKKIYKCFAEKASFVHKREFLDEIVDDIKIQSQLWQKVFKRELFDGIQFSTNIICMEDYAVLHKIILKANKVYYLNKPLYFYRIRKESLVTKVDLQKSYQCYLLSKERYNFLVNKNIKISKIGYLMQALGFCMQYQKVSYSLRRKYYDNYLECKNIINENICHILRKKNLDIKIKLKFLISYLNLLNIVIKIYDIVKMVKNGEKI